MSIIETIGTISYCKSLSLQKNVGFYFFLNVPFLISNYPNGKKNKDICIQYYSHKNFIVEIQSYASIKPT